MPRPAVKRLVKGARICEAEKRGNLDGAKPVAGEVVARELVTDLVEQSLVARSLLTELTAEGARAQPKRACDPRSAEPIGSELFRDPTPDEVTESVASGKPRGLEDGLLLHQPR